MTDLEARRAARRAAMPIVSAWVDQYAEFGATVVYAVENGITVGKKPGEENVFNVPAGYGMVRDISRGKRHA